MGLFSSTYKTVVGTSVSSFNDSVNYLKIPHKSIISDIAGNGDFTDNLLFNIVTGSYYSSKSAHKFAESTYTFGRPDHHLLLKSGTSGSASAAYSLYLTGTVGATAVFYTKFGTYNYYHNLYKLLQSDQDLNFTTGLLGALTDSFGVDVFLYSTALLLNPLFTAFDADSLSSIGFYPTVGKTDAGVSGIGAEITYRYVTEEITGPFTYTTEGSSTTTSDTVVVDEGPADYTTTSTTYSGYSYSGPTITNTTEAAAPPDFYQNTAVERTSDFTYYTKEVTTVTYVGATTTKTTEVVSTPITEEEYTLRKTHYRQATQVLSSDLSSDEMTDAQEYLMAAYLDAGGNTVFSEYRIGAGNSLIDGIFNQPYTVPGSYLPRLYFRWDNQRSDVDLNSIEFKHGKRMCKKLGMDYVDIIDAVHKITGDRTQADLDLVKSSFLSWLVEADASNSLEIEYLFHHFEYWFNNVYGTALSIPITSFLDTVTSDDLFEGVLVIQDKRFKVTAGMQGLWKKETIGSIGVVGTCTSSKGIKDISYLVMVGDDGGGSTTQTKQYPYHIYRKQLTENSYTEYLVIGIETKYYVLDGYSSVSEWTEDVADPRDILYVPVNFDVLNSVKLFNKDELCYRSMRIVNNSVQVIKVRWYQRSGWALLMKIAAIVAMVYGFTEGYALITAAAATATASVWTILQMVLTQLLLPTLKNMVYAAIFVKVVGEDLAFIAAVVATIYGFGSGQFNLALPYAKEMLVYSNSVLSAVNSSIQNEYKKLAEEITDLAKLAKTELKALEDELDLYKPSNQAMSDWIRNESPSQFFTRTIGMGNIGPSVYDLQRNTVKLALTLPKTFV